MSAAIIHNNASIYHDCGEFLLKTQSKINNNTGNNTTNNNNNTTMLATINQNSSSVLSNNNNNNNNNSINSLSTGSNAGLLQQHLNVINVQINQQHQQQHHQQQQPLIHDQEQKNLIHNALTRAVSHPQNGAANVVTLMNTLIENLGNVNAHRKLERTQSEPLPQQVNTSRYKTELCRPFEEAGECKYGEKCQFAHGYHELRNLQRHPKYKTEYCRTFHSVGFCPYGPRCHFVHNADEARAMMQQQQQQQQQQQHQQNRVNFNNIMSGGGFTRSIGPVAATTAGILQQHFSQHPLPLSPPLSMSTGSDRASPTGSLSLSPTNSMASFPFVDQISPGSSIFTNAFSYNHSPPASPNSPMSPISTPPPSTSAISASSSLSLSSSSSAVTTASAAAIAAAVQSTMFVKPILHSNHHQQQQHHHHQHHHQQQQQQQMIIGNKSTSPIAIIGAGNNSNNTGGIVNIATSAGSDEARLPVFNRLSSAVDAFSNLAL